MLVFLSRAVHHLYRGPPPGSHTGKTSPHNVAQEQSPPTRPPPHPEELLRELAGLAPRGSPAKAGGSPPPSLFCLFFNPTTTAELELSFWSTPCAFSLVSEARTWQAWIQGRGVAPALVLVVGHFARLRLAASPPSSLHPLPHPSLALRCTSHCTEATTVAASSDLFSSQ